MIVGFRDKRIQDLAEGKRVKAFEGTRRKAEMKLDQLDAALTLADSTFLETTSKVWVFVICCVRRPRRIISQMSEPGFVESYGQCHHSPRE